jgi:hypothetical protein
MESRYDPSNAGGFLPGNLPSPSPSVPSTSSPVLPRPRATALRPGGPKENAVLNFIDGKLRDISGKFERRFQNDNRPAIEVSPSDQSSSTSTGYSNFAELAKDLEHVVDVLWVSGTRAYTPLP